MQQIRDIFSAEDDGLTVEQYAARHRRQILRRLERKHNARVRQARNRRQMHLELE
jgi:hypothetical protein